MTKNGKPSHKSWDLESILFIYLAMGDKKQQKKFNPNF